jgi:hypothetical protein
MNKKDYQKPTMKVVKLEQKCNILVVSGGSAGVQDYDVQETQDWN